MGLRVFVGLFAVGLVVAACGGGDSAETTASSVAATTTTAAPVTTTTDQVGDPAGEAEALAVVEAAFAAFNSGDMDTWALWREGGQATGADFAYALAAEGQFDVEQCTYRGLGVWQMDGPLTGHGFDCAVTHTDLILAAAGIELEMTYNWVIGAGAESSLGGSNEDFQLVDVYLGQYREWLATSHPDVEASIEYDGNLPTAASVPAALEYIDEFVAQSDAYPLTEPVPEADYYGGPLR